VCFASTCCASIGCRIVQEQLCGSHYVIFGAVEDVYVAGQDAALIYANRHYGRMATQAA
jgi:flavin reductase (DIM6/NTAB) family NADH-FMN oxidoreductase RutF